MSVTKKKAEKDGTRDLEQQQKQDRQYHAKVLQMMFHWTMAALTFMSLPTEHLFDPITTTEQEIFEPRPTSVALIYLAASTYNCVLYFWDPVESSRLRLHHLLSIFLGTMFAMTSRTDFLILTLLVTYVVDTFIFVSRFQKSQGSSACLRSMIKIHHMATILLLAISWSHGAHYYGCFVMFIHDMTDVPMFVVRLIRNKPDASTHLKQALVIPVILFTWLYYRVYLFGHLIWKVVFSDGTVRHISDPDNFITLILCSLGMFVLWAFNVYWTCLVVKKTITTFTSTNRDDENEDE